jgi:GNAT acetyltransferase-like protein
VELKRDAPVDWDSRISHPILGVGFAEASRTVGYQPRFVEDGRDRALVLLRGVPLPLAWRWTLQAKVYADTGHPGFLEDVLASLAALGVARVTVNDESHGLRDTTLWAWRRVRPTPRYVFLVDLTSPEDELRRAMQDPVPRNIRKAERAGVVVEEVRSEDDLRQFTTLIDQTSERIRARRVASVYPAAFFAAAFHRMVPRGQALFLLARAEGQPLAAQMYLVTGDRLVYYHGGSTRDRALTPKHGSTAAFWHALRLARARGLRLLDLGGASPTTDSTSPQYSLSDFKRRWGGRLTMVPSARVVLAPLKAAFQEHCLAPLWDRLHPLYLRLFDDVHSAAAPAVDEGRTARCGPALTRSLTSDRGDGGGSRPRRGPAPAADIR